MGIKLKALIKCHRIHELGLSNYLIAFTAIVSISHYHMHGAIIEERDSKLLRCVRNTVNVIVHISTREAWHS